MGCSDCLEMEVYLDAKVVEEAAATAHDRSCSPRGLMGLDSEVEDGEFCGGGFEMNSKIS